MRYTVRQTLVPHNIAISTKLQGAQCAPELALRNMEFCSPENLRPLLVESSVIVIFNIIFLMRYAVIVNY